MLKLNISHICWISVQYTFISIGDQLTFTVLADDLDQDQIEYRFSVSSLNCSYEIKQDWSTSNTFTWMVDQIDYIPKSSIYVDIRDDDGFNIFGFEKDYLNVTYDDVKTLRHII